MSKQTMRVVIRQPLHGLIQEWSKTLGIDDVGEIVNFLLLDLKRNGHLPSALSVSHNLQESESTTDSSIEVNELAGLF
jgi:hypothetical protein